MKKIFFTIFTLVFCLGIAFAQHFDQYFDQIENIARHYAIDTILHGDSASSLEKLIAHCDRERLEMKECRKIGF